MTNFTQLAAQIQSANWTRIPFTAFDTAGQN